MRLLLLSSIHGVSVPIWLMAIVAWALVDLVVAAGLCVVAVTRKK